MPDPSGADDPIEALLASCLELPAGRQRAAVEELCRKHPELAALLRERFAALERFGLASAPAESFPERLGDFRLLDRLGGGGMGVVFLAEQVTLGRKVALKVVRPELLYFEGARARFKREIEAVARLQHPGIVPVYTVGEDAAVPYFAMEHVQGKTLGQVLQALNGRDPSQLSGADLRAAVAPKGGTPNPAHDDAFSGSWTHAIFRVIEQVAAALEHAHERGVVHRDVKPSNIIVTHDGRAMLLDFGIAAMGDGGDRLTRSGAMIGSLPYMTPEQVRGETSGDDPRIDVYALGVTLYELLTLRLPFQAESVEATQREIVLATPRPPRERNPALSWEAETVCLTAMEQEPARRYATAAAFAADVRNVLALRPIAAQRPSTALRMRRWVQRHPTRTTVLVALFLLVVVGPSVAWVKIRAERDRARKEAAIARGVSEFFVTALKSADPNRVGTANLTMREFLAVVRTELSRFDADPATKSTLMFHMGEVSLTLGDTQPAIELLQQCLALRVDDPDKDPAEEAVTRIMLAQALAADGQVEPALAMSAAALATLEAEFGDHDTRTASAMQTLAGTLFAAGRLDEAEPLIHRAIAINREHAQLDELFANLGALAMLYQYSGRAQEAEATCREAIAIEESPGVLPIQRAQLKNTLAMMRKKAGDLDEADRLYGEVRETYTSLGLAQHPDLVAILNNLARVRQARNDLDGAQAYFNEALAILVATGGADGPNASVIELGIGRNLMLAKRPADAAERLTATLARMRATPGTDPYNVAMCCQGLGDALIQLGRHAEAKPILESALESLAASGRNDVAAQRDIAALLARAESQ